MRTLFVADDVVADAAERGENILWHSTAACTLLAVHMNIYYCLVARANAHDSRSFRSSSSCEHLSVGARTRDANADAKRRACGALDPHSTCNIHTHTHANSRSKRSCTQRTHRQTRARNSIRLKACRNSTRCRCDRLILCVCVFVNVAALADREGKGSRFTKRIVSIFMVAMRARDRVVHDGLVCVCLCLLRWSS